MEYHKSLTPKHFFITLGRLFDVDGDAFSVHSLLRCCVKHLDQFSFENLRQRKIECNGRVEPEWLENYMREAYQPTEVDFQCLRGEVSKQQKSYEKIYRPIRHRVIAHKEIDTIEKVSELFEKTNMSQVQEFINFLYQIDQITFNLLHNGKLNPIGYYNFADDMHAQKDLEKLLEKLKVGVQRN